MKQIEIISENEVYTALNIGSLDKLTEHTLIHPKTGQEIVGKFSESILFRRRRKSSL